MRILRLTKCLYQCLGRAVDYGWFRKSSALVPIDTVMHDEKINDVIRH